MSEKSKPHANQGHSDPNKAGRDQYKRHVDGDITIRGQVETHLPPSTTDKHDAEREEDKGREKKKFVVEVLTLIAVIIYAGLTWWQGSMTREIINNSSEQFRQDQRAWVASKSMAMHIKVGDPIYAQTGIANAGKTPAFEVKVDFSLKFSHIPLSIEEYVRSTGRPQLTTAPSTAVLLPGVEFPLNIPVEERMIAPPELPDMLLQHKQFIYLFGEITYEDAFKRRHLSRFCGEWDQYRGAFEACKGNYESAE
jgi:hypothetical protein